MGPARLSRIFALAAVLAASMAHGVIYKSTTSDGRVTFSDIPVDGAVNVQRVETSEGAKANVGAQNAPVYLALLDGFDEAVRQANDRVDTAERALAMARRSILGDQNPLTLVGGPARLSTADRQLIEFYKRDVASARRNLARLLQQRALLATRPVA